MALSAFVYLAVKGDQAGTAAAAATLCLALAVLAALDLESFEGLGIKAKLRTTLSDAERRLDGINDIVSTLASGAFIQIVRGNLSYGEQMSMIAELTTSLVKMDVDADRIDDFKKPVYEQISQYLYFIISAIISKSLTPRRDRLRSEAYKHEPGPEKDRLLAEADKLDARVSLEWPNSPDFKTFRHRLSTMINDTSWNHDQNRRVLLRAASDVSSLFEECLRAGNFTSEAVQAIVDAENFDSSFMRRYLKDLTPE